MKVKKLYGCIDSMTGELQRNVKYAYLHQKTCVSKFENLLKLNPTRYKIVELRPVPLLTEVKIDD
jgi:hypothetical protein